MLRNERETLTKVAAILRGEAEALRFAGKPVGFDMNSPGPDIDDCDTACCIGGHAFLLENPGATSVQIANHVCHTAGLHSLYYPYWADVPWSSITPDEAAAAIDNYLEDGNPRWAAVLGRRPRETPATNGEQNG